MKDPKEVLRSLPYFAGLPDDLLDEVTADAREVDFARGQCVITEGERGDSIFVVLDGELEVSKEVDGRKVLVATVGPGQVQGEMALLEDATRSASVEALTDSRLLEVPAKGFRVLLDDPGFVLDTLKLALRRLRESQSMLQQEERMAALGKMAAQLMHELNNPAAALQRSVEALGSATDRAMELAERIVGEGAEPVSPGSEPPTGALAMSDLEGELASWLQSHGVSEPWALAPPLARRGWTPPDLDRLPEPAMAEWEAARILTDELVGEVRLSASRIAEIVRVVKDYSFLDRAPVQDVNVVAGINDTLTLLKHKLKGVEVSVEHPEDTPTVVSRGRDLNQVWTNLIDNAADAMDGAGSLRISIHPTGSELVVEVANTGDPIPDNVLPKIFDPFFTTKEPGKGTGLGLHTVHTIVNRIGGRITAASDETGTVFTVALPLNPPDAAAAAQVADEK